MPALQSTPQRPSRLPQELCDPHYTASKPIRASSPPSFLPKARFLVAVAMCAAVAGAAALLTALDACGVDAAVVSPFRNATDGTCVCNYDPSKDYFPIKLKQNQSTQFSISYAKTYKTIVVNTPDMATKQQTYVLVQCGTPVPDFARDDPNINVISIPVDTVMIKSTTHIPFITFIGQRLKIRYVGTVVEDLTPCLQLLAQRGTLVTDEYFGQPFAITDSKIVNITRSKDNEPGPDLILSDSWSLDESKLETATVFKNYSSVVLMREDQELSALAKLEWIYVAAALFNEEAAAVNVVGNIVARAQCNGDFIKNLRAGQPQSKLLWLTGFSTSKGGAGTINCPGRWQCDLLALAQTQVINVPDPTNITELAAYVAQADVVIFASDNFNQTNQYGSPAWFTAARRAAFGNVGAFATKKVFDILGARVGEWFDAGIAEPDVMLLDFAQALYGDAAVPNRRRKFLRNVFTEPIAPQVASPSDCPDPAAPRYTEWLVGPCSTAGNLPTTIPVNETIVDTTCKTRLGSGAGKLSVGAIVGVVAAAIVATF